MAADLQEGMESRDDPAKRFFCFKTVWFWQGNKKRQISSLADQCFRKKNLLTFLSIPIQIPLSETLIPEFYLCFRCTDRWLNVFWLWKCNPCILESPDFHYTFLSGPRNCYIVSLILSLHFCFDVHKMISVRQFQWPNTSRYECGIIRIMFSVKVNKGLYYTTKKNVDYESQHKKIPIFVKPYIFLNINMLSQ